MAKMADLDYTIKQWFKDHIAYILMVAIVVIIAFLIHAGTELEKQKQANYIYDLKAKIDSLEQTIDYLEGRTNR